MNILVTGANGQLGNEMQLVSKNSKDHYIFTDVCDGYTKLDITNIEDIRNMVQEMMLDVSSTVQHGPMSTKQRLLGTSSKQLNAVAPENLAKVMKEVDGLLVHISTDYVFGGDPYNTPCKEDMKGTPTGVMV